MKKINKVLTIAIIIGIIFLVLIGIYRIIEPLMYNSDSNSDKSIKNYGEYSDLKIALDTYISYYIEKDYNSLKSCTSYFKKMSDEQYEAIYNKFILENCKKVLIHDIKKCFNNVYIIKYSLNMDNNTIEFEEPEIHKIVIKLFKINNTFKVYCDGLINEM